MTEAAYFEQFVDDTDSHELLCSKCHSLIPHMMDYWKITDEAAVYYYHPACAPRVEMVSSDWTNGQETTVFRECPTCGRSLHALQDSRAQVIHCSGCGTEFEWTPDDPVEWMNKHYGLRPSR